MDKDIIDASFEAVPRTEKSDRAEFNRRIEHGILGICDEAGELAGLMKKCKYYNKPFDIVNLIEELGDHWWYFRLLVLAIAETHETSWQNVFETIMLANGEKLEGVRYKGGYTDNKATGRDLKKERAILEDIVYTRLGIADSTSS